MLIVVRGLIIYGFVVLKTECFNCHIIEVSKDAKIRNRYNQVPYLTQDTNGKVTNSQ